MPRANMQIQLCRRLSQQIGHDFQSLLQLHVPGLCSIDTLMRAVQTPFQLLFAQFAVFQLILQCLHPLAFRRQFLDPLFILRLPLRKQRLQILDLRRELWEGISRSLRILQLSLEMVDVLLRLQLVVVGSWTHWVVVVAMRGGAGESNA